MPTCNLFTLDEPIAVKMTFRSRPTLFDAFFRGKFPHPAAQNFVTKFRVFVAPHSTDYVIVACTFDRAAECDEQTDRQTPMVESSTAYAVARKKLAMVLTFIHPHRRIFCFLCCHRWCCC